MKQKRLLCAVISAVMLVGTFSACGAAENSSSDVSADSKDETKQVTLQYWYQGTDEQSTAFAEKCVGTFNAKYPNIKVEATGMSGVISDQETKLNAAVLSDTYPDVISVVLAQVGSRGSLGDFEELQPYVDNWDEKDNLFDSAYEMGKYQGDQVSLGYYPNPQLFVYRKDSFTEAGLDPESPPTNWAELKEAAEKLTKREGDKVVFAGLDIPSIDSSLVFTEPFMRTAGSKVIDELELKPAFTDKSAIEALDFIGELAAMNISIPYDQQKADESPFLKGNSAISYTNVSGIAKFKELHPDVELGYLPILSKDGSEPGTAFCGYQLISMGTTSKYKDESWEFIKFMLSDEVVWNRYETLNTPIIKNSLEEKYSSSGNTELNKAILNYVENGKGKATVPWVSIYNKYVSVAYEEVINQKKTAEQALTDAETQLLKEIS